MNISATLEQVQRHCSDWEAFCDEYGWSVYACNEGGGDITVTISVEDAVRHGIVDSCLRAENETQASRIAELEAQKDGAYLERNQCVALIARMALANGWPAGVARTAIEGWSEDWHGCVYIDLPTGQVSWHYHDSQAYLFDRLPAYVGKWDGHDTPQKYRRVEAALSGRDKG